jgi:hypothetical protein
MPFHTPFYTPLAAGVALGHFRDAGLDITAVPAATFGKPTIDALLGGDIEISLGGGLRSSVGRPTGQIVVHFAEVQPQRVLPARARAAPGSPLERPGREDRAFFAEAPTPGSALTVLRRHGASIQPRCGSSGIARGPRRWPFLAGPATSWSSPSRSSSAS